MTKKKFKIYLCLAIGFFVVFLILLGGASISIGDTDTTEEQLIGIGNASGRTIDVQALIEGDKTFAINDGVYIMIIPGTEIVQVAFTLKMQTIEDGKIELYLCDSKNETTLINVTEFIGLEEIDIALSCSIVVNAEWNFGEASVETVNGSFLAFRVVNMSNSVIIDCSLTDFRIY